MTSKGASVPILFSVKEWMFLLLVLTPFVLTEDSITLEITDFTSSYIKLSCEYESDLNKTDTFFRVYRGSKACVYRNIKTCQLDLQNDCNFACLSTKDPKKLPFSVSLDTSCDEVIDIRCTVSNTNLDHVIDLDKSLQVKSQSDPPVISINNGQPLEASCSLVKISCTVKNVCQKARMDISGALPMKALSLTHTKTGGRFTTTAISEAVFTKPGNYTIACKESGKSDEYSRNVTFEVTGRKNLTESEGSSCQEGGMSQIYRDEAIASIVPITVTLLCICGVCGALFIIYIIYKQKIKKGRKEMSTAEEALLLEGDERYNEIAEKIERLTSVNISHNAQEILDTLEEGDIKDSGKGRPLTHLLAEKTEELYKSSYFRVLFSVLYRNYEKNTSNFIEHLSEVIWKQMKSLSIDSKEKKKETIQKLKNFTNLNADLCSRLLWKYTELDGSKWNSHFLDVLTFLIKEGGDPFAIYNGTNAFTLSLKDHTFLHLEEPLKSSALRFIKQIFNANTKSILNDIIKFLPRKWFRQKPIKCPCIKDVVEEECFKRIKDNPSILEDEDEEGRTPLHNLMAKVFTESLEEIASDTLFKFIEKLITKEFNNVNKKDKQNVTPYCWICLESDLLHDLSQDTPGPGIETQLEFIRKIKKKFKEKGASEEKADPGIEVIREKKMESLLKQLMSYDQNVASHFKKNGTAKNCIEALKKEVYTIERTMVCLTKNGGGKGPKEMLPLTNEFITFTNNYVKIQNEHMLDISSQIMDVIIDDCNAKQIYDIITKLKKDNINYHAWLRVIKQCTIKKAVPQRGDIETLLTTRICKTEKLFYDALETVEVLITAYRKENNTKRIKINLDPLQNQYKVSKGMREKAGKVIRMAYRTVGECIKSGSVINMLLFLEKNDSSKTIRTCFLEADSILEKELHVQHIEGCVDRNNNLFQRKVLHLAVIFCHDEQVLKSIPEEVIKKNTKKTDLHGCTPLHIAYLHDNTSAINLFKDMIGANVEDHFGRSPEYFTIPGGNDNEENNTEKERNLIGTVTPADMQKMLILSSEECKKLEENFKELFEKMLKDDDIIPHAKVEIGGSMRERLKVGQLDELDLQILTSTKDLFMKKFTRQQINVHLLEKISKLSREDCKLRLIAVGNPWKFLWERESSREIALDIDLFSNESDDASVPQNLKDIINDVPRHLGRIYLKLDESGKPSTLKNTTCQYEWDILDNLPRGCRIGILIAKASLLEALEITSDLPERVITAQVIKTTTFWLVAGRMPAQIEKRQADDIFKNWVKPSKLQYSGNIPDWATKEDVEKYGEEGRKWAVKIFETICYIAKNCGVLLDSFLLSESQELYPLEPWQLYEAIDTCEKCLERLK